MYNFFTSNAGHSTYSPGASGNGYKEHEIARSFNKKLIDYFKKQGYSITDTTSDGKTSSLVLQEQVSKCNYVNKGKNQLDISIHLNAAADKQANGIEVLYYDQKNLAATVSKNIALAAGFKDRGAKERKDLYFLRNTTSHAILIELCFITNKTDMDKLINKEKEIIEAIFTSITGKKPVATTTANKTYKVQVGSFSDKTNADKLLTQLKEKGFSGFVKYE